MSKTLSSIIQIAGIAVLAYATAGIGASVALGYSVGTGIAYTAASLGISSSLLLSGALVGLQSLLGGSVSPKAETTNSAIKTERPPRISAYGRLKLFGAYILYETAGNGVAVDVWVFHDGRIDGIEGWYLGDKVVTRLANGYVQQGADGAYGESNIIQIDANLGASIGTAHAAVIAALPGIWTTDHRGDGVVTGYMLSKPVKAKNYQEVYPAGGPNQQPLAIVIRAQPVYDWRDSAQSVGDPRTWKWSENSWLHIAHYRLVQEGVGPSLSPSNAGYWAEIASLYTARWARLFAPTLAYWTAAANDADSAVPLRAGGTEPRYRSCVSHRHAGDGSEHKSVLAALLLTCDGWMSPRADGALVAHPGRYYAPTVSVGPDEIISYTVEEGVEDENAVNQINVTYISAAHDFNTVDTDPWTDEDDISDRGAVRSDDLAPQTPSFSQNRRLAKRKMAQAMAPSRGTFVVMSTAEAVLGERFIMAQFAEGVGTEDEFVAYAGPIEITQLSRNLQTGAISGSWIAADPNIDAWNPATEEGEPAPVGDRVAREPLAAATITTATVNFSADSGGGAPGAFIHLVIAAPNRDDLTWSARTRVVGASVWGERDYTDIDPSASVTIDTEFVPTDAQVEVQVQYQVGDGRSSPWSASKTVNTSTADVESDYDGGNASGT